MSAVVTTYADSTTLTEEERVNNGFVVVDGDNADKLFFHHYLHEGEGQFPDTDWVATDDYDRFDGWGGFWPIFEAATVRGWAD
jgi:hypothetical protein